MTAHTGGPPDQPVARELSPQEKEAEAKLCYSLEQNVVAALNKGRAALWELAENLASFDAHSGWLALGFETKSEWLAQPEISMTQRTYRRYVRAWRVLSERYQIDRPTLATLEMSKVDIVLPAVEKGDKSVNAALQDVQSMGARDLREEYWGPEKPQEDASGGETPKAVPDDGIGENGPVRAADGVPVDLIFDKDGEVVSGDVVDADVQSNGRVLEAEEALTDLDAKTYIRCTHCGGIVNVEDAEKAEAPPV